MDYKKTKIVCTIGPSSNTHETIKAMVEKGMDVARLNFSHGIHAEKGEHIKIVRRISQELNQSIAVVADLQGPKLRLGDIEGVMEIVKDQEIDLSTDPKDGEIPIQIDLSPFAKEGQRIYLNDGLVELTVLGVEGKTVKTRAKNNGWISSKKGVNIPDTDIGRSAFTEKDREDAVFALGEKVDYLALSFVRTAADLEEARKLIKEISPQTKIIVKIEKKEAIENLEQIIEATDAIMIARGDLATETSAAEVPIFQQKIILLARQQQKPVIVATQMLESMTQNPRPTRAEASDVANAVLNEVDAVMLSGESASGKYPVEAVQTMSEIIVSVEQNPNYKHYIKINWESISREELHYNAISSSASSLAYRLKAALIAISTSSGLTAQLISSFRPTTDLIAVTHSLMVYNQLSLVWGVRPILLGRGGQDANVFVEDLRKIILSSGLAHEGVKVVMIGGSKADVSGFTDTIKVVTL